jgi:glucans biosynthesis protein C
LKIQGIGYNVNKFKLMAFILSAFFSGLAGGFYALLLSFRHYGPLPFLAYYSQVYFGAGIRPRDRSGPAWPDMTLGHLWFIEHLLIFAICYALWRLIRPPLARVDRRAEKPPRYLEILAFTLVLARRAPSRRRLEDYLIIWAQFCLDQRGDIQ